MNQTSSNNLIGLDSAIEISGTDDTVFDTPILTPEQPNSNESLEVGIGITDPDGIQNATLYWQYDTINSTLFNTTMTESTELIIDVTNNATVWNSSGYITDTGIPSDTETDWRFGNFTLDKAPNSLNSISSTVDGQHPDDHLVYYKIQKKDPITGDWTLIEEAGSIGGTTDLMSKSYLSSDTVAGYNIMAIVYDSNPDKPDLKDPQFVNLEIGQKIYSGTITAPDQPSFVSYNVTAFDGANNSDTSDTYSSLFDWTPDVVINNLPSVVPKDQNIVVNATVNDLDGYTTINNESVIAYYKLERENEWSSLSLNFSRNVDENSSIYTGEIPAPDIGDIEENMTIQVNASDIVENLLGRTGNSILETVVIDNRAPRVLAIDIEGNSLGLENITLGSSNVTVTVLFEDASGIQNVSIYYAIPSGGTFSSLKMANTTKIASNITSSTYSVILPAANQTTYVDYFFETIDFFGNIGNTTLNTYFSDLSAPDLSSLRVFPDVISNITSNVQVLFNVTDDITLRQSLLWYSMDNQTSWTNIIASSINYTNWRDYVETFAMEDLPFLIPNNQFSNLIFNVERGGKVNNATLNVGFTHELSSDLRLWLVLEDGREFVIFDREAKSKVSSLSINLFDLGLTQSDFDNQNFTLKIRDFSDLYTGSITDLNIVLEHYEIPLGYQFVATIPKTNNDTDVYFYLTLTDHLFNSQDTSVFDYYSDGLSPHINVTNPDTVDLDGSHFVNITAKVVDKSELNSVELQYRFSETGTWTYVMMSYNNETGEYYYEIRIKTTDGTLYYQINAFDLAGHVSKLQNLSLVFERGLRPLVTVDDLLFEDRIDANEASIIRVTANVTAYRTIEEVVINYRYDNGNSSTEEMMFDETLGLYYFDIPLILEEGSIQFTITASDDQFTTETEEFQIDYFNAKTTSEERSIDLSQIIFISLGIILLVGVIGSTIYFLRKKGKI